MEGQRSLSDIKGLVITRFRISASGVKSRELVEFVSEASLRWFGLKTTSSELPKPF